MPGTVKIWWHDGATRDIRYNELPVANEPELGFEILTVGPTAVSSGAAPEDASVAIIESDTTTRYLVLRPGETGDVDPATSKAIVATGLGTESIGVRPGYRISFIEA